MAEEQLIHAAVGRREVQGERRGLRWELDGNTTLKNRFCRRSQDRHLAERRTAPLADAVDPARGTPMSNITWKLATKVTMTVVTRDSDNNPGPD